MIEQWLEITPLDTLFFRGGEPMEAGETHEAGRPIFPPVPETIIGALRTAILAQRGIDPRTIRDEGIKDLPLWGTPERPGFWVAGPVFKVSKAVLFPAPASWFYHQSPWAKRNILVYEAQREDSLPVKLPRPYSLWVKDPPEDMDPLSGRFWLTRKALENERQFKLEVACSLAEVSEEKPLAVPVELLIKVEERVGIERDDCSRTVKKGHLYAARHVRLERGISLLVGMDKPLCPSHLDEEGIFQLGGEGRLVRYRLLKEQPRLPGTRKGRFLAISPLFYGRAGGILNKPYASGKLLRVAGWDLRRRFHKPTKSYFPAGAVFFLSKDPGLCELIPF